MNLAEFAIRKKTVTLTLTGVVAIAGIMAYQRLGRLEDPEFTIKTALVMTSYPGASPTEVEQEVTNTLEEAIQQLDQLDEIRSLSQEALSIIFVDIKDKYSSGQLPQIWDELRRKVGDAQAALPPGARPSQVNDDFGDVYGVFFAITGDGYSMHDLREYADDLKRELLLVQNVAKVDLWGVQQEVVYVEMKRSRMSELGITPDEIYGTLQSQNLVSPSGRAHVGREDIRLDPTGEFLSVEEIGDLLIRGGRSESMVRLKDVVTVQRGYEDPPQALMMFNGKPAVGLGVSTVSGGNVITMGEAVKARLKELESISPVGTELHVVAYQSDTVSTAVDGFVLNLVEAVVIVVALLLVFMGLRSGLLIGLILLLTILGTFAVMAAWHIDLQKVSLGALIIALGMLVDNAIVVVEGVLVRVRTGRDKIQSAVEAVAETKWPLLGATLVAILAFGAIGFSEGNAGEFCYSLFLVIGISLLLSWVLAVTTTPLLCTMFLKPGTVVDDAYAGRFYRTYRRILAWALHHRLPTMVVMVALLGLAIVGFRYVENSFFPESTRPQFYVDFWRPQGTHITDVARDANIAAKFVQECEGVESVTTFVGQGALRFVLSYDVQTPNTSYGQLLVTVDDYRKIATIVPQIEQYLHKHFPDAEPRVRKFINGPGGGAKIEARFRGPNPTILRSLAEQAKTIMRADPGARDVRDDWRQRVKVVRPVFSEARARRIGVTASDLRHALNTTFSGTTVGVYREGDDLLPIIARPVAAERRSIENLNDVQIWCPVIGRYVPLNQVVSEVRTEWEDGIIRRRNRAPTITAQCDQKSGNASVVFNRLRPKLDAIPLPPGYELLWGGEYDDSQEAQQPLAKMFPICLAGMFLIVLCLFNTFRQPVVIFLCLPLAIIGVTAGLLITGKPFGFMAILGFLSLSGMLIKNAIVLVEQITIEQTKGKSPYMAVLDAGVSRIRPVMMASMSTVLGMAPLLFDPFFDAMAVTIMSGLTFATVLTLVIVPVFYVLFYRIHPDDEDHAHMAKT